MPSTVTVRLEYSEDPLSDTTPTYVNATAYLRSARWWSGKANDRDDPQPGGAELRLKNTNRDFEPEYGPGLFDVDIGQRFRLFLNRGAGDVQQGLWYAADYTIEYPSNKAYSEVVVTCVDGFELLSSNDIPALDPPDATTFDEVVQYYDPWGYWRLGDPVGTKMVTIVRRVRRRGRIRKIRRKRSVTIAETTGVSGPTGTYKNTPTLGAGGGVLGDLDTAVTFNGTNEYAVAQVDVSDAIDSNRLTLLALINISAWPASEACIIGGPNNVALGTSVFRLTISTAGNLILRLYMTDAAVHTKTSAFTIPLDQWVLVAGRWDGTDIWVHKVTGTTSATLVSEFATPAAGKILEQGAAGQYIHIARSSAGAFFGGTEDEPAIWEKALETASLTNIFTTARLRGFDTQTVASRIDDLCTGNSLLASVFASITQVGTGSFDVNPEMMYGQSRLDMLRDLCAAEQPHAHFFFDEVGLPVYLGHNYKTIAPYTTVQATFGDSGSEVRYSGVEFDYDNEVYNEVTVNPEDGAAVTVTDSTSIAARGRRVLPELGLIASSDADCLTIANALLTMFKDPSFRPTRLHLNGGRGTTELTQIMDREIGDLITVKRRGEGGTAISKNVRILGFEKSLAQVGTNKGNLTCTYNLSRP